MRDPKKQAPRVRVGAHGAVRKPNGRTAYPRIVQYQLGDGQLLDLPPEGGEVNHVRVHNLPAYDRLRQAGSLEVDHRLPAVIPVIDNRSAPGA